MIHSRKMQCAVKWFLGPALLFFVGFYFFSPQYWGHFNDMFFIDGGDGYQNVWNIWWIDWAVAHLHQSPWVTQYVHWPSGMSLISQTMNPFNGLLMLPFIELAHLNIVQAVNTVVIFSFVTSGITMMWFVYYINRSYAVAVFAGALFTFSSYHFSHAIGHMQLISMEWVPLFMLAWWRLIEKPSFRIATGAALALFLVMLCDYYYLFYSVIAAVIILAYFLIKRTLPITKRNVLIFLTFGGICLATIAPFFYLLVHQNAQDPLLGAHDEAFFSLDPLMLFIPASLDLWKQLGIIDKWPFVAESGMYLGLVLLIPLFVLFFFRRRFTVPKWLNVWWIIFFVFAILALGPRLRVWGHTLHDIPLPYAALTKLVPTLEVSGMPMRMIFMAIFAAIVIASFFFKKIDLTRTKGKVLFGLVVAVFIIDMYPRVALPRGVTEYPPYVTVLKDLQQRHGTGIVDDAAFSPMTALYYQTVHHKPLVFGYTTRIPTSVQKQNTQISDDINFGRQDRLCQVYNIRYFATRIYFNNGYPIIYNDPQTKIHIYDVKNGDGC